MNQRRSPFVVLSVTAHAIVLGAILAVSLFAPDLLPEPRTVLAWAPERIVQPVDINLPEPPRSRAAASPHPSPASAQVPAVSAPLEPPTGIAPESGREAISNDTVDSVIAIERGGGAIDGVGIAENPPPPPPSAPPVQTLRRLHHGIQAPVKIVDVAPAYPPLARQSRREGIVILDVIIDEQGNVASTRVLKSVALLDQAAIDAVQRWKFKPARLNDEAIPIVMTVTISFRLQ